MLSGLRVCVEYRSSQALVAVVTSTVRYLLCNVHHRKKTIFYPRDPTIQVLKSVYCSTWHRTWYIAV